jgi:hypothetical protein
MNVTVGAVERDKNVRRHVLVTPFDGLDEKYRIFRASFILLDITELLQLQEPAPAGEILAGSGELHRHHDLFAQAHARITLISELAGRY